MTDFIQYYPDNGSEPSEKTQAWLYYDDFGIYLGFKCFDRNKDSISIALGVRDSGPGTHDDLVSVLFCPYNDGTNYFYFLVTPTNVQTDVIYSTNGQDKSWDAVWYSETSINDNGWTTEIMIPYSALRFSKKEVQNWGFNVNRWNARRQEWSTWNFISIDINNWWTAVGEVQNITNIDHQDSIHEKHYVSGYVEKENISTTSE